MEIAGCPFDALQIPDWVWEVFPLREDFKGGWDPIRVGHVAYLPVRTVDALRELDRIVVRLDREEMAKAVEG